MELICFNFIYHITFDFHKRMTINNLCVDYCLVVFGFYSCYIIVTFPLPGEDEEGRPRLGLFDEEFYIHPDETSAVLEDSGVLK